jgi:hypothetical protein
MYGFHAPGSTREKQKLVRKSGFATKSEVVNAERERRNEMDRQQEMTGAPGGKPLPRDAG